MTDSSEIVPYVERDPVAKNRTILVLYRHTKSQRFEASMDTWMFLPLESAEYGICGQKLDMIMLMDGITKLELVQTPAWVALFPCLKEDGAVLEAS